MSEYFPEPKSSEGRNFSNYATKTDFKNARGVDMSSFAKKVQSASLKSNEDKLDIDKPKNVPANLSDLKVKKINLMLINWCLFLLI